MRLSAAALLLLLAPRAPGQSLQPAPPDPALARPEPPPLYQAIVEGDLDALRRLLPREKADAQIAPPFYAQTPLSLAAAHGRLDVVKYLVETLGADPERSYRDVHTKVLDAALQGIDRPGNREVAAYLLGRSAYGADLVESFRSAPRYDHQGFGWPPGARVVILGERHGVKEFPYEVGRLLRSLGATHLATEFLLQSEQELIDAYESGRLPEREFLKKNSHPRKWPAFAAARKIGARLLGLDLDARRAGPGEDGGRDSVEERNRAWLAALEKVLDAEPRARVVVYCGSAHSDYGTASKPVSELLAERYGAGGVFVANLAGGSKDFANGPEVFDLPTYAAQLAGRSRESILVRPSGAVRRALRSDAVIHLGREPLKVGP
jgi:hypothetical protein